MNKTCARCEKTVYPTEELKCLDKVWHKGCFKCQECGMTLNMRTYKGYGKLPYCEAHVPKAKHTTMAETPELKRIAENTKIQSNVKYHADFEKSKGKFTQVADDPETLRIKANTKIISNVAYHGDLEKKAQMEKQRQINENGEIVDVPTTDNYHQQIENYATEMLSTPAPNLPPKNHYQAPTQYQGGHSQSQGQRQYKAEPPRENYRPEYRPEYSQEYYRQPQQQNHQQQQQIHPQQQQIHPQQQQQQQHHHQQQQKYDDYNQAYNQYPKYDEYNQNQYTYGQYTQPNYGVGGQQKIGRIQDYDPLSDGPRAVPNTQRSSATLIYNSTNSANDVKQRGSHQSTQQTRQIGRVTDLDPLAHEQPPPPAPLHPHNQVNQNEVMDSLGSAVPFCLYGLHATAYNPHNQVNQRVYIAMYDYEANDSDEVSFLEGDYISNVSCIDEGWMTGRVLRTGLTGMLPANYVQLAAAHQH